MISNLNEWCLDARNLSSLDTFEQLLWFFADKLLFYVILQALYFCVPFREQLLEYYANNKIIADAEENLLTCLADLFSQVMINESRESSCCFLHGASLYLVDLSMIYHRRICIVFTDCN